jgi:protocatechuate 3,4-dioxygenase alpha subunit
MSEPVPAPGRLPLTSSQTAGPYLTIGCTWPDGEDVVPGDTPGAFRIVGRLLDGAGEPVSDGLVETWQADPAGRFDHPDDPRGRADAGVPGFRGFGRSCTDAEGGWGVLTVLPGSVPAADGTPQAPHLDVSVLARGLLDRVITRIYFPEDGEALARDPVLRSVPEHRRSTLVAQATGDGGYRFDIHLQGDDETVFFDL